MTTTQDKVEWMRSRWNDAARNSLLYSIATSASDSEDQFIRSGFYDVERILKGLPAFDAEQDTALEIGCGIGRLLRGMNDHFSALYGIDISDEMIARGRAWLGDFPKITLSITRDNTLREYPDQSINLVYSHITFQHIVDRELIELYLAEAYRVLKPGGWLRFQTLCPADGRAADESAHLAWHQPAPQEREGSLHRLCMET